MHEPYTQLHVHFVWATWDRLPIIRPEWKAAICACAQSECDRLKVLVVAQYVMPEHMHLLVQLPTTVDIATVMKQVKGSSSHLITHQIAPGEWFKWQGSYGAFAVSKSEVPLKRLYIQNQELHHQSSDFQQEWDTLE